MELIKTMKKNLSYNALDIINSSSLLTLISIENGLIKYKTLSEGIKYIKEEIKDNKKIVSIYK
jgi:hypothetical protein